MRGYELMTIHRPEMSEEDVKARVEEVGKFLGDRGASIEKTDLWGKRRLAYEIDHLNEGYYSVMVFSAERQVVDDLDRVLGIADDVVRHKLMRTET